MKHCIPNVSNLDTITDDAPHQSIIAASKQRMRVAAIGTKTNVVTAYPSGSNHEGPGRRVQMAMTNVWAVPGLAANLFSCSWGFEHDNIRTVINDQKFFIMHNADKAPPSRSSARIIN